MASNNETTPAVTATKFPSGEAIYTARYVGIDTGDGERTLKWSEMRAHFKVSARSSRFLQEVVAYVNGVPALLERHPEMAYLNPEADDFRAVVKAAREKGQGFNVLRERTGLKIGDLRKLVGEEVGTTSRVAWGQRYAGKLPATEEEATEAAADAMSDAGEADLAAALEASVEAAKAKPRKRRPRAKKAAAKAA